ncbi:restriction endonuclease subunit S [Lachnospiraceae bacterium NSJ-171]|nr:restriction endonuclease subunit S [Lachnospiraceae bacterium NSJ-171]
MKNDKKPQVRFKGFNDDWEQRKLGEMGSTFTGLSGKTKEDFGHGDAKFITYMNVFSNPIANLDMTEYVEIDSKQNCVKAGDVFFTTSSETPEEVGMSCVMSENADNIYLNSFCFGYRPTVEFDLNYLAYVLRAESFRKNMTFLAQGISRYNISKNKVMEIKISVPSLDEQNLVGAYFSDLDHLITLHQRKCDKLQKIKKSMLEKMFPQNGMKKPEIRFKGFNDDWEQRKVGEFLTESRESGHKGDVAHKMTVKLWGKGVYEKNETGSANTQYFTRHAGQFIYSKLDFLNCAFGVVPEELDSLETTADVPAFDCDGVNPYFMFYTAIQPIFYEKNGMIADGSRKAKRIHANTFLEMPFFVPSLTEQNKIVNLLSELDHLITLHQRKLEKLKYIKKSMLENMFV